MDRVTELAARWQAAEQQLYPSLLFDEQRYEQAMLVVRAIVDELGACTTPDELVAAYDQRDTIVADAARAAGVELAGLEPSQLAAAAFRMRLGAIRDAERERDAADAVDRARTAGGGWATVAERGVGSPPQPPYERLCLHVPAGGAGSRVLGVHSWVGLDEETDAARYGVAVVSAEPARPLIPSEPIVGPEEHDAPEPWEEATSRLAAWVETRPEGLDSGR